MERGVRMEVGPTLIVQKQQRKRRLEKKQPETEEEKPMGCGDSKAREQCFRKERTRVKCCRGYKTL